MYISDTALLLIRKLVVEMSIMIHDQHNREYVPSSQTTITGCPEPNCMYIVMMMRDLDREFMRR